MQNTQASPVLKPGAKCNGCMFQNSCRKNKATDDANTNVTMIKVEKAKCRKSNNQAEVPENRE